MNQILELLQFAAPVFFPVLCGLWMISRKGKISRKNRCIFVTAVLVINLLLTVSAWTAKADAVVLWNLTKTIPVLLKADMLSKLFTGLLSVVWLLVGIFSFEYMKHEENAEHEEEHTRSLSGDTFYGFYLMVLGVMTGVGFAGNLITFYLFYEFMTLLSVPFVLHTMTKEAVFAAKKYLYYSVAGASLAVFGFAFLYSVSGGTIAFVPGGVFSNGIPADKQGILLFAVFLLIIGFGTKAGMFPMHGWLPSAHPVAPAPASAVLSGMITKTGVLGILRVIYYLVGADNLRGTWVQYAFLVLTLITVFMGSMLAYKEQIFKKRLAYSTVSQVSYVLFGIALLHPVALIGSLLHIIYHSVLKCTLFLNAGAVIYKTGKTKVEELVGIGKEMPVTMWTYTIAALGLVGIPPVCGFISKWYLCLGALDSGTGIVEYLGPVILLLSALLTAGYLLPITIKGFFPGAEYDYASLKKKEPNGLMIVPMTVFAAAAVLLGMFPNALVEFFTGIVTQLGMLL
ncbi:MAG: complex I subunit 5 family protein [Lachnospiraceae bacterium]